MRGERPLVIGIEAARPDALLIQILVRHDNQQTTMGPQYLPPARDGPPRIDQVLQAVAGVDPVELLRQDSGQRLCVTLRQVPVYAVRRDRVVPATDIDASPKEDPVEVPLLPAPLECLACLFSHGETPIALAPL